MTRRRVLFLFPFPSLGGGGGAQRVFSNLLRHLDHDRFELHLALLRAKRGEDDEIPAGVVVHDLNYTRVRYAVPALIRLIREVKPDAVLSTIGHMNLALLLSRPWLPRATGVLIGESTTLSVYLRQAKRYPRIWMALYRWLYKHADKVICLSDAMKREMAELFAVPPEKLVRIYNPLDVEMIRRCAQLDGNPFPGSGPHLVAAGRFVREKGNDLLLDAMPRVLALFPHATLTLLGEGPLEKELKQQVQKLELHNAVRFGGLQPNPWRYFRHANLVIVPSRVDGLPYVPLEALAVGTPVVATDCPGGIREVSECGERISLVPPEAPNALAEGIISALKQGKVDREQPAQLDNFNLQQVVNEYSKLLETTN
ncbi:MAG: glycosyltransferase [Candidatus Angelobacter sp.]